ncbi:MAG: hypothetical protein ABIE92_15360 [bacterium]
MKLLQSIYHLNRLKRRLTWPEERLHDLRCQKLTVLLNYCYSHSPYYREQFDKIGAKPEDFRSPEDLCDFPVLDKERLRDRGEKLLDPNADRSQWLRYRSSGSTGIPLELWYLPTERLRMGYTVTREMLYNGLKPWHSMVNITEPRHAVAKDRWYHRLGVMNEQFLSVYDQADLNLGRLAEIKPQLLIGFPSVLMLIGRELQQKGGLNWRPKLLFTLAEVLTAEDRKFLSQAWGVEPIDLYGANEVGHLAFQCSKRNGYHVNTDSVHVELIENGKPVASGQRGEIVVTNFDLRVMPMVRYRVGDIAAWSDQPCGCGCTFPLLKAIAGRSDGFIIGEGGKVYSALEVSLLLKPVTEMLQYRLLQIAENSLTIEVVPASDDRIFIDQINKILRDRLGQSMSIEVDLVKEIPREKSGKIRSVVSTLPHPFWRE